jgi:predicted ATPase
VNVEADAAKRLMLAVLLGKVADRKQWFAHAVILWQHVVRGNLNCFAAKS